MAKKILKKYYKLLDKKIWNSLVILFGIAIIIASIWNIVNASNKKIDIQKSWDIIMINGKTYKLVK
jgi:predicted membrane protein